MPNPIPPESRSLVERRDLLRCVRCGGPGAEWHHRRRRNVKDEHQHCTCNGVLLCKTCHGWAHGHPIEARNTGFIVSAHQPDPGTEPVRSWLGEIRLDCFGEYKHT